MASMGVYLWSAAQTGAVTWGRFFVLMLIGIASAVFVIMACAGCSFFLPSCRDGCCPVTVLTACAYMVPPWLVGIATGWLNDDSDENGDPTEDNNELGYALQMIFGPWWIIGPLCCAGIFELFKRTFWK